jgi:hypothetical protein
MKLSKIHLLLPLSLALGLALVRCGGGTSKPPVVTPEPTDSGTPGVDAGEDAGEDAGVVPDAGEPDGGEPDAGEPDGGHEHDAGEPDAGEPDAGEVDAGEPDAGEPDAGDVDAGEPDAGIEIDAGVELPAIVYTTAGVVPNALTVDGGQAISIFNNDLVPHRFSSNPHPVHDDCPEINAAALNPGESATVTVGPGPKTCGFHDHFDPFNSALQGTLTVQ